MAFLIDDNPLGHSASAELQYEFPSGSGGKWLGGLVDKASASHAGVEEFKPGRRKVMTWSKLNTCVMPQFTQPMDRNE